MSYLVELSESIKTLITLEEELSLIDAGQGTVKSVIRLKSALKREQGRLYDIYISLEEDKKRMIAQKGMNLEEVNKEETKFINQT